MKAEPALLAYDSLQNWFETNVPGAKGPIVLDKFTGGQSNPTFRASSGTRQYVLRRKPFGTLLASAHAIEREYRLLSALHPVAYPVPRPLALCEDAAVIGAPFYVMELMDGTVYWDGSLPHMSKEERSAIYGALVDALAALHRIEPTAVGLADFGGSGDFFARQLNRWTRQYRTTQSEHIEEMEQLIDWLPRHKPRQGRASIVHGDYRIDNVVFAPDSAQVAAVLDWELATIGDPLFDLAYLALAWVLPAEGRSGLVGVELSVLGIPLLDDMLARYCAATGRDGVPDLPWLLAFSLFRLAVILQGVGARAAAGNASSDGAVREARRVVPFARAAWDQACRAGKP